MLRSLSGKTASEINLGPEDMPGWTMAFNGRAGLQGTGLVDDSGRSFVKGFPPTSGVIVGSQAARFDTEAHARAFFDQTEATYRSEGYVVESPSSPPVGSASLFVSSLNAVVFQKGRFVMLMEFTLYGSGSYSRDNLMTLAQTVEIRIPL